MKMEIVSNGQILKYDVRYQTERKDNPIVGLCFRHTDHSFKRASQRGLLGLKIATALEHGKPFLKQGLIYFVLGESDIPETLIKETKKLRNTVVVLCGSTSEVITCYRSKNPYKHLKQKRKDLVVHKPSA